MEVTFIFSMYSEISLISLMLLYLATRLVVF